MCARFREQLSNEIIKICKNTMYMENVYHGYQFTGSVKCMLFLNLPFRFIMYLFPGEKQSKTVNGWGAEHWH
jgi:hypothetical protein